MIKRKTEAKKKRKAKNEKAMERHRVVRGKTDWVKSPSLWALFEHIWSQGTAGAVPCPGRIRLVRLRLLDLTWRTGFQSAAGGSDGLPLQYWPCGVRCRLSGWRWRWWRRQRLQVCGAGRHCGLPAPRRQSYSPDGGGARADSRTADRRGDRRNCRRHPPVYCELPSNNVGQYCTDGSMRLPRRSGVAYSVKAGGTEGLWFELMF